MGRRDAVQFTLEWAAEARRLGAEVTFEPGWETRGNGMSADYEGMEVHHTGFGSSETNPFPARNTLKLGRPDLGGPLTNVAGPWCPADRPRLHVLAAHPSNNAGASGAGSKNLGPLPRSLIFNKYVFALEIDYGGNVAMVAGQRLAALIFSRAGTNVLRRSTDHIRAHAETSVTGKWDPGYAPGRTIDMAAFRRDAAALATQEDDDMTPDQVAALNEIRGFMQNVAPAVGQIAGRVADIHGKMTTRYDLDGRPGPDEDDLYGHILSARAAVEQAPVAGKVAVDAAAVGAALAADDKFMGALSARIADDIAARLQS